MLSGLAGVLIFQNAVGGARTLLLPVSAPLYLVVTFVFLGLGGECAALRGQCPDLHPRAAVRIRWELFLLDPMVFLLWGFVAVSLLFWGRGVFCGWLCPFGALQELLNQARAAARREADRSAVRPARAALDDQICRLPRHPGDLAQFHLAAFGFAEIEPFKTAITLKFMRDWPFVLYAGALLVAGLFVERFFCRYLCPLGAALAIPARMRMFEWLKRYRECGSECQICARRCTVQAIHPLGQINPNECIYCLKCQANYFDHSVCCI
jgi:polyferredoxin